MPNPDVKNTPQAGLPNGVHLKSLDVSEIPTHLVVFALWLYARPHLAAVSHTPKIESAADVKAFLDGRPANPAGPQFQWLDGRCVSFALSRGKFNVRDYDAANGKNVALRAIEEMRKLLNDKTAELGSKEKAVELLTNAKPGNLEPRVERFFSVGLALFDELCAVRP